MDEFDIFMISLLSVIIIGGAIAFAAVSRTNLTEALRTQCANTANTLQSANYSFDDNHKCNIVTQDGKLVSF